MTADISLVQPKENLDNILGINSQLYWKTTRLWYKNQISKEEYNKVAKELLGETNIHIHNEFVLALLLKCQLTHRSFKKGLSNTSNGMSAGHRVSPCSTSTRPDPAKVLVGRAGLASQDRVLPDEENITSRCLTSAWENNVDVVGAEIVPLLKLALQMYTQRILTDCVKACKTFQADEHCIPYGFNQPHPTISLQKLPSLISLNKCKTDDKSASISSCICNEHRIDRTSITVPHLIQALYKLKSKKIGLMNIERAQCYQVSRQRNPQTKLCLNTVNKMLDKETSESGYKCSCKDCCTV